MKLGAENKASCSIAYDCTVSKGDKLRGWHATVSRPPPQVISNLKP